MCSKEKKKKRKQKNYNIFFILLNSQTSKVQKLEKATLKFKKNVFID